ncbi:folate-binding protein YgfZ [Labrenzia sp. DG1229]|uniref:CAF17-like 4Fe-4S cluster assembly/insertion protein YgfZ n=1 Tax=Labrenzia sp. DG1229 TaxID=681847 RepID=UPI00048D3353|nr:folate-binding protein YgfZ [Labrenzia sp. DG1229]
MPSAKITHLPDRALIRVAGDDAHHFLQNLVTADIEKTDKSGASAGALLTPQGKILFDFLIYKTADGYLLDAPLETAPDLLKRLTFYRLRAKVDLEFMDEDIGVIAVWNGTALHEKALLTVTDPRVPALGERVVGPVGTLLTKNAAEAASLEDYDFHRIALGVPEGLKDYDYSDIFPHDADLDQLGGVSFTKGCYVGQEVVSRVHHRGTSRKRFVLVESSDTLPEKGTPVTAGGKSIGELGSNTGQIGLALVRLDKAAQAKDNGTPLQCGVAKVQVRIPDWASFSWPEPSTAN